MAMETLREKVMVLCYCNASIKYGPHGVFYEGSNPKKIRVGRKTALSTLMNGLYPIFGFDKQKSEFKIFGRFPVVVSPDLITYVHFPVVNDPHLETMLEIPSNHPSIKDVELYLEVKSTSDDVVNLTMNNGNAHNDLNVPGLEASANPCLLNKGVIGSSASKPWSLSSLWVDDHELRVGLCFKGRDELKKAVDWCSIRGQQKCVVNENENDEYMFECIRWKCNFSLQAARIEEHRLFEITKCSGPHTCCSIKPENFNLEFAAEEIECLIRVQPTLQLQSWKIGGLKNLAT